MVDCLPPAARSSPDRSPHRMRPAPDEPDRPSASWSRLCDGRPSPAPVRRAVGRAGAAGRPRAGRLDAGRPGRRVGAGRPVRRGPDRPGRGERRLHGGASLGAEMCWPRPAARTTRPGSWANCCGAGSRSPDSVISCTRPATPAPSCCSTWCAAPHRSRASSRWPRPCSPRSGEGAARAEHRLRGRHPGPRGRHDQGRRGGDLRGGPDGGLDRPRPGGLRRARAAAPPRRLHRGPAADGP